MEREYKDGISDSITMFTGKEVEKTSAVGEQTLFVVGNDVTAEDIIKTAESNNCTHIYLGANQSFAPSTEDDWSKWNTLISAVIRSNLQVTLDFDVVYVGSMLEFGWNENFNFIPMISVKLPFIDQLGYNAVIKLDDIGYEESNPGVWIHNISDLTDRTKFTSWREYTNDKIIY